MAWLVERNALRPLNRLAASVAERSPSKLDTLAHTEWPAEFAPVVSALNAFLERVAHALESQIHVRLDRATHLVEQLLSLASHEAEYNQARTTQVDVRALIEQVVSDHAELAESRGIDLGVLSSPHLSVRVNHDGLQCMLTNLVDNALRYTPPGGRVDLAVMQDGDAIVLNVADDGPGIAPEHREHIFERFYWPAGRRATGPGLGLAIVKHIVDHHGAAILLLPGIAGDGLTVQVRFPIPSRTAE